MTGQAPEFSADERSLAAGGIVLADITPLIDGAVPACVGPQISGNDRGWTLTWSVGDTQRFVLTIDGGDATGPLTLKIALEGLTGASVDSLGLRIGCARTSCAIYGTATRAGTAASSSSWTARAASSQQTPRRCSATP